jgi:DNA-directed RNA polymerase III subunit RPC8
VQVLREQIEIKYSNRILLHVGLCVTFYDFISIGDPYIYPSEGSSIQIVRFRMVVFRPFVGETMTGKLVSSNREGLKISVDFFDDILIPAALLQAPCVYNPTDGLWTWKYGENHDTDFVMDIGEEVYILLGCRTDVAI